MHQLTSHSSVPVVVSLTPEKLHKEAAMLQLEAAKRTNQDLPSSAFMLEQEA